MEGYFPVRFPKFSHLIQISVDLLQEIFLMLTFFPRGSLLKNCHGFSLVDENFSHKHDKPFLLSMANRGKDTNGSQFFM